MAGGFFAFGAEGLSFKGKRKSERRIANVRVQASGSLGNHRMGGAEPECPEYPARGSGRGHDWLRSGAHSWRSGMELADATARQYPARFDRQVRARTSTE